jgi:predicted phage terminase large subunit-like protein
MFQRTDFEVVDAAPATTNKVRRWDLAATDPKDKKKQGDDPDWTVGLLLSEHRGIYYIEHIVRDRKSPAGVETMLRNTASQDGRGIKIVIPQDPGAAGKSNAAHQIKLLAGWNVKAVLETGSKVVRAEPVSAQAEAGNIKLIRGPWNEAFLEEVSMFPSGAHDDQVDGLSGAFAELVTTSTYTLAGVG